MDLTSATKWRNLAGKAGALFCIMVFLCLLDGLIARFREPANVFKVLPGTAIEVNGPITEDFQGIEDLTYVSETDHLTLSFAVIHKGYFLGGDMWRGQLTVSPQIQPGEYRLIVTTKGSKAPQPPPAFRIMVYPDPVSLRHSDTSLISRYLGLSPWGAAAACVPGILLAFGMVYYLSGKIELLLAHAGKAEVYRVLRREDEYVIHFALGTMHGVGPGACLPIFDDQGRQVGTVRVEESEVTDSTAVASAAQEIKTGYMVSLL